MERGTRACACFGHKAHRRNRAEALRSQVTEADAADLTGGLHLAASQTIFTKSLAYE